MIRYFQFYILIHYIGYKFCFSIDDLDGGTHAPLASARQPRIISNTVLGNKERIADSLAPSIYSSWNVCHTSANLYKNGKIKKTFVPVIFFYYFDFLHVINNALSN